MAETAERQRGTIKAVVRGRRCAFIVADDGSGDVYLHASQCADYDLLEIGDAVQYRREPSRKVPGTVVAQAALLLRRVREQGAT
jgi:cold shock CspA family protein